MTLSFTTTNGVERGILYTPSCFPHDLSVGSIAACWSKSGTVAGVCSEAEVLRAKLEAVKHSWGVESDYHGVVTVKNGQLRAYAVIRATSTLVGTVRVYEIARVLHMDGFTLQSVEGKKAHGLPGRFRLECEEAWQAEIQTALKCGDGAVEIGNSGMYLERLGAESSDGASVFSADVADNMEGLQELYLRKMVEVKKAELSVREAEMDLIKEQMRKKELDDGRMGEGWPGGVSSELTEFRGFFNNHDTSNRTILGATNGIMEAGPKMLSSDVMVACTGEYDNGMGMEYGDFMKLTEVELFSMIVNDVDC